MSTQTIRRTAGHAIGVSGTVYVDRPRYVNHRGRPISAAMWVTYQLAEIAGHIARWSLVGLVIYEIMAWSV